MLYKTFNIYIIFNIYKTPDLYRTLNIYRTLDIRKVLLPLDGLTGTYRVSKVCEDKAYRPILDMEEVTILLSINTKGLRILFSKDLYIYLVKED